MNNVLKAGIAIVAGAALAALGSYAYIQSLPLDRAIMSALTGNRPADVVLAVDLLYYISPCAGGVGLFLLIVGTLGAGDKQQGAYGTSWNDAAASQETPCPKCLSTSDKGSKYCQQCGAPLFSPGE